MAVYGGTSTAASRAGPSRTSTANTTSNGGGYGGYGGYGGTSTADSGAQSRGNVTSNGGGGGYGGYGGSSEYSSPSNVTSGGNSSRPTPSQQAASGAQSRGNVMSNGGGGYRGGSGASTGPGPADAGGYNGNRTQAQSAAATPSNTTSPGRQASFGRYGASSLPSGSAAPAGASPAQSGSALSNFYHGSPSASQMANNYAAYRPSQGASAASTSSAASVPNNKAQAPQAQSAYQGVTDPLASERVAPRFGTMPNGEAYVQYNGQLIHPEDNFYSPEVQNFSNNPKNFTPHNVVMHYTAGFPTQSPQSIKNAALGRYKADGTKSGTNFGVGIDPVTGGVAIQHYTPYG